MENYMGTGEDMDYPSEVFAFAHRIGAPEVGSDALVKALTTASYLERADVDGGAEGGMPSGKEEYEYECNTELVQKGKRILDNLMKAFLRFNLQNAPEELIEAVNAQMTSDDLLANIGFHIGIEVIIRTGEHPPAASSVADALRALLGVIGEQRAQRLIIDLIVPQLIDVDFADAYPLNDPLAVLSDLLKRKGASELEPRLLRSMGEVSAQPVFVVGIYKDKQELVGQSAGESIEAAVDLAAREGLLRLWGLTSDKVFFFGNKAYNAPLKTYSKENFRLNDVCSKGTDLSVQSVIHLDPMNIVEVALRYKNEVEAVVGKSYTKRLRHKFSRGSLAKRSFRYLVKPKVYTVA